MTSIDGMYLEINLRECALMNSDCMSIVNDVEK